MSCLLISAAHKSSGKTLISIGLCAAFSARGLAVQPFKKGPDYIDPLWLSLSAQQSCYNLDFNTQGTDEILRLFATTGASADISLVEANKGLYDGLDVQGSDSNAALAGLLDVPVVLVVDVQGFTRGIVPLISGYQQFDPDIRFAGVILNKVATARHEKKLREAIEYYLDIPVSGAVYKDDALHIDERHLGLVPGNEYEQAANKIAGIRTCIEEQVDIDQLLAAARTSKEVPAAVSPASVVRRYADICIGVIRDAAFGFYYPDDLLQLKANGARLVMIDALADSTLPPDIDGLFIGGGFPEMYMQPLRDNRMLRLCIRDAVNAGLPTYAECGGLMYLCREIRWRGKHYEMVGALPADVVMYDMPQGRGYMRIKETARHPWPGCQQGREIKAHEFHHSRLENLTGDPDYAYQVNRGSGIDGHWDGLIYKNTVAGYAHVRDTGQYHWTRHFTDFVRQNSCT